MCCQVHNWEFMQDRPQKRGCALKFREVAGAAINKIVGPQGEAQGDREKIGAGGNASLRRRTRNRRTRGWYTARAAGEEYRLNLTRRKIGRSNAIRCPAREPFRFVCDDI